MKLNKNKISGKQRYTSFFNGNAGYPRSIPARVTFGFLLRFPVLVGVKTGRGGMYQ